MIQYGNSLFSKQITASFDGGLTPVQVSGYAWLYEAVALVGYFSAAFTVDRMGRRHMQLMGFAVVAALFFVFGGVVPTLQRQNLSAVFVFLYCEYSTAPRIPSSARTDVGGGVLAQASRSSSRRSGPTRRRSLSRRRPSPRPSGRGATA